MDECTICEQIGVCRLWTFQYPEVTFFKKPSLYMTKVKVCDSCLKDFTLNGKATPKPACKNCGQIKPLHPFYDDWEMGSPKELCEKCINDITTKSIPQKIEWVDAEY